MAASLSDHVSIVITRETAGVRLASFGTILILSHSNPFAERTRTYSSLSDVAEDFSTTDAEYLQAVKVFGQNPRVRTLKIGRCAAQPVHGFSVAVSTVASATEYALTVRDPSGSSAAITYTSDSSATNDEIASELVSRIAALAGSTLSGVSATTAGSLGALTVAITVAAGSFLSVENQSANLAVTETAASTGLEADLNAIAAADADFYCVVAPYASLAYSTAVAAWCEANKRLALLSTSDTAVLTTATDDIASALKLAAYQNTALMYHPTPATFAATAWAGKSLPWYPGQATWKFKTLAGVAVYNLTSTQRVNLNTKNANYYEDLGVYVTTSGTCANGFFIDDVRGLHWLEDLLQKRVFGAVAAAPKVSFTDAGVAVVVTQIRGALAEAVNRGVLREGFSVSAPLVKDVSSLDKASRTLPDVAWEGELQGAIHRVIPVSGKVAL